MRQRNNHYYCQGDRGEGNPASREVLLTGPQRPLQATVSIY